SASTPVSALALVLVGGSLLGGGSLTTALGLAGAAVLLVPAVAILLALRSTRLRRLISVLLARVTGTARRVLRRPPHPGEPAEAVAAFLTRVAGIRVPAPGDAEGVGFVRLDWSGDAGGPACAVSAPCPPVACQGR